MPDGPYYDAKNFHDTGAGESFDYSNVGFGLLGFLAESIAGKPFEELTRERIFEPLGMDATAWHLRDLDLARHGVPYDHYEAGAVIDNRLTVGYEKGRTAAETGFIPICLYSFFNYPDGLVRTSVRQLARFLIAHLDGRGLILRPEALAEIWRQQVPDELRRADGIQGLAWRGRESEYLGFVWSHGGADPGVRTHMIYRPEDGIGVIIFVNKGVGQALIPVLVELFAAASSL